MKTIISALHWVCDHYGQALSVAYSDQPDGKDGVHQGPDSPFRPRPENDDLDRRHERLALALVYF